MRLDMADVKPTLLNVTLVTMMAVIGIHAGKYLTARWNIPGFKELFGSI